MGYKVAHQFGRQGVSLTAATTYYPVLATGPLPGMPTTEAHAQDRCRTAGVWSRLRIYLGANAATGDGTLRFRKGGADGNMLFTIPAGVSGWIEYAGGLTDAVADGDLYNTQLIVGTGGAYTTCFVAADFEANDGTAFQRVCAMRNLAHNAANSTRVGGTCRTGVVVTGSESDEQAKLPIAITARDLRVYVSANSRTNNTTVGFRNNGANAAPNVTFGSGATGEQEETATDLNLSVDDLMNMRVTTGSGTQTITFENWYASLVHASKVVYIVGSNASGGRNIGAGLQDYRMPIGGREGNSSEANSQALIKSAQKASNLRVFISSNTLNGEARLRLRINGADTALVAVIAASTTGWKQDDTNVVDIAADDLISLELETTDASVGSITYQMVVWVSDLNVATGTEVLPSFISSANQVFTPGLGKGIAPSFISASSQAFSPAVIPATVVQPGFIAATSEVFTPGIGEGVQPEFVAASSQVFTPGIGQGVAPEFISSANQVFSPAIGQGVQPNFIAGTAQVFTPGIGQGVQPSFISSVAQVFTPGIGEIIEVVFIGPASEVFSPTVEEGGAATEVQPSFIPSTAQVFTPGIGEGVEPSFVSSTAQVFTPGLGWGIEAGFVASGASVFAPEIEEGGEAGQVFPGFVGPSSAVFEAAVIPASIVLVPSTGSTAQVFQPVVVPATVILVSLVSAAPSVFAPMIVGGTVFQETFEATLRVRFSVSRELKVSMGVERSIEV